MERWTGIGWNPRPACVESAKAVEQGEKAARSVLKQSNDCPLAQAAP